jgi:aryl carrier-like protein
LAFDERLAHVPPHLLDLLGAVRRKPIAAHERAEHGDLAAYLTDQVARLVGSPPKDVDRDSGLNELGIDSLMAVRLRNRLKADWNLEAPIVQFMENPSIRMLAESLQNNPKSALVEGVL